MRDRFALLMARAPEKISLDEAALVVAAEDDPTVDVARYQARLDGIADAIRPRLLPELDPRRLAAALSDELFGRLAFRGNESAYYDPRNSYLHHVIDRRLGIPITLSIVYIAVGTRLGLPLAGVSFPSHFVVTYRAAPEPLYIDPFHRGAFLTPHDLRGRLRELFGDQVSLERAGLHPARPQDVLARLLRNLKHIYARRGNLDRAIACSERILLAADAAEERRDLGLLMAKAGRVYDAIAELRAYLAALKDAPDEAQMASLIAQLEQAKRSLH
jgi:regulator of sirC expression with transglutaminase-like and TPR domain